MDNAKVRLFVQNHMDIGDYKACKKTSLKKAEWSNCVLLSLQHSTASMYYYRNKRKKSNKAQSQPKTVERPLNDVWESFQEPKSYKDYGLSDEAFAFLSDRDKCEHARENNKYWNSKKRKLDKVGIYFSVSMLVFILLTMTLLGLEYDTAGIISAILLGLSIVANIVLAIPNSIIKHKMIQSYDDSEWDYNRYKEYIKKYIAKRDQYLTHIQELEDFKTNKESDFLDGLVEKLKQVQGRTYRTAEEWYKMTDRDFEFEIGKVYSRLGYQTHVTKRSGDGGVDVIAKKDNETIYIQCKHYGQNTHLGAPELQAFWGCCSGNGISKGVMVCTSSLTKDAKAFAKKLKGKLEIVGMKELLVLDKTFYQSHPINSQKQFTDAFKTFISSNNFIDCDHLWLKSKVYYKEEDAKTVMETLTRWKNNTYLLKDTIVNLTNKIRVYVILLVPDYSLDEVESTHLK